MNDWVSLHRKMSDSPIMCKDSDCMAVWIYLLLNATHAKTPAMFKGQKIMLDPGRLIAGRKTISDKLHVTESKVQRVLRCYENEQQVEQQTGSRNHLITIKNWDMYQVCGHQNETQLTDHQTASERPIYANNNVNNKINILCSPGAEPDKTRDNDPGLEQMKTDFEKIYAIYSKKGGEAKAFEYYCAYVKKGRCINKARYRLTSKQIYLAVRAYTREWEAGGVETYLYKNFNTFMSKAVIDYLPGEDDL